MAIDDMSCLIIYVRDKVHLAASLIQSSYVLASKG